jgi:hypothetical protein
LIEIFREILKIVKLNCEPVLRQVTGIAQTTSELRHFLPDPPEERAFLVSEAIAHDDSRCTAFARTGNLRLPKISLQMPGSHHFVSDRCIWKAGWYLGMLKGV